MCLYINVICLLNRCILLCNIELNNNNNNNCGCGCGIIAAELEGLNLELVTLQKSFESKLECFVTELETERTNVNQLKQELADEKPKTVALSRNWPY